MSGQVDPSRSKSIQVVGFSFFWRFVWLGLGVDGHWFVVAVLGGAVMGGRFVKGSISRIWWVFCRYSQHIDYVIILDAIGLRWGGVMWGAGGWRGG